MLGVLSPFGFIALVAKWTNALSQPTRWRLTLKLMRVFQELPSSHNQHLDSELKTYSVKINFLKFCSLCGNRAKGAA